MILLKPLNRGTFEIQQGKGRRLFGDGALLYAYFHIFYFIYDQHFLQASLKGILPLQPDDKARRIASANIYVATNVNAHVSQLFDSLEMLSA